MNMLGRLAAAVGLCLTASCSGTIQQSGDGSSPADGPDSTVDNGPPFDPASPPDALHTELRRMTRAEVDFALEDLLGDLSRPAARLLADDAHTPFDNDSATQEASAALIDALEVVSREVTDALVADAPRFQQVVGCATDSAEGQACFDAFAARMLPLALRRPLESGEIDAYLDLWAVAGQAPAGEGSTVSVAVGLLLQSILQDPEFLYRIEAGSGASDQAVVALTPHEVATRLSFAAWGRPPDEALLAAATEGRLDSPEGRAAELERLLADPRTPAHWHRYHAQWLGYRESPHDAQLAAAFERETAALIDRVMFSEPQSYLELFRSTQTFVDDALADHYGMARPEGGEGWVTYEDPQRAGILSHGSVLSAFNKFTDTSPTQRGILVRERLMCSPVLPPPPTVDVDQPPGGTEDSACKIERYTAHMFQSGCEGCHSQIDPIGFGLEQFDMAGQRRAFNDDPACTIDGQGALPLGLGDFSGPRELGERLIAEGVLQECVPEQMLTFLLGRQLTASDAGLLEAYTASLAAGDYRMDRWLRSMIEDPAFTRRRVEAP